MRENHQKHRRRLRRRPNGAAAFGGRPIGSVFLMIFSHRYLWILLIQSWYIPYMFPRYVPCTGGYFPLCVSLWFLRRPAKCCWLLHLSNYWGSCPILLKKLIILIKNHKIINKNIKIVNLGILKVKTWFGDKDY